MLRLRTLLIAGLSISALGSADAGAQYWTKDRPEMCDTNNALRAREPGCLASVCVRRGRCYTNVKSWSPHPNGPQQYYVYDQGCMRLACRTMRRTRP